MSIGVAPASLTLIRFTVASAILTVASAVRSGFFSTYTKTLSVATGAFLLLGAVLHCWNWRSRSLPTVSTTPPAKKLAPSPAQRRRDSSASSASKSLGVSSPARPVAPVPIVTAKRNQGPSSELAAQPLSPVIEDSEARSDKSSSSGMRRSRPEPTSSAQLSRLATPSCSAQASSTTSVVGAPQSKAASLSASQINGVTVVYEPYPEKVDPDELLIVPERSDNRQIFRLQIGNKKLPDVIYRLGRSINPRASMRRKATASTRGIFNSRELSLIAGFVFPKEHKQVVKKVTVFIADGNSHKHVLRVLNSFNWDRARDWMVTLLGESQFEGRQKKILIGPPPEKLDPPFRCYRFQPYYIPGSDSR